MESNQQQHRSELQQRSYSPSPGTVLISASSSSNFPAITEHTRAHLDGNKPLSNMYSFTRPEVESNISMEPSMFMAGAWEPSLLGLPSDRQVMAQNRAHVTSSYGYYLAPHHQPDTFPFKHSDSPQDSFLNPNIALYESPLLSSNSGQSLLRRPTSTLNRESHPLSHVQTPYDSRYPPATRMQSRGLVIHPGIVNYPRESTSPARLSPAVTRSKGSHDQPSRKLSAEDVGYHDKPYAYLLYEALCSAKDHRMSLQEIYRWFEENTNKANDPQSKGWQSSIRHNLSMNEVRSRSAATQKFARIDVYSIGFHLAQRISCPRKIEEQLLDTYRRSPQEWSSINYTLPQYSFEKTPCIQ